MKWTLHELKRRQHTDNHFKQTLDMTMYLEGNPEIQAIEAVEVSGKYHIEADRFYHFDLTIDTAITMACAITLEPILVPIHIEVTETFSEGLSDDCHRVEGITVDLWPIIWSNIYLEKPMRVVKPDASFESDRSVENRKTGHPAFEALKKFKE